MRKLNQFQRFDFNAFQTGKTFMIQSVKYNDKKECVSLDVVITEDDTDYGDESVSNIFETFKVHLINEKEVNDALKYHVKDEIIFKGIGKCSVWGEYNNQLSVEASIEVVG